MALFVGVARAEALAAMLLMYALDEDMILP